MKSLDPKTDAQRGKFAIGPGKPNRLGTPVDLTADAAVRGAFAMGPAKVKGRWKAPARPEGSLAPVVRDTEVHVVGGRGPKA